MFYQAGGYFFRTNPAIGDTPIDITADVGRGGCGAFGFLSTLKSVFAKDALDNYLGSVASSALSSAPLLLLSYASPTMADVYKHLKVFAQAVARTRFASCEALKDLAINAGAAARARSDAQYACLNQKLKEGKDLGTALDECGQESKVLSIAGKLTPNYDLTNDVLAKLNIQDPLMKEYVAKVLGDVRIGNGQLNIKEHPYAVVTAFEKEQEQVASVLEEAAREMREKGELSPETIKKLTFPGTVVAERTIAVLDDAPPNVEKAMIGLLKARIAMVVVTTRLMEVASWLRVLEDQARLNGSIASADLIKRATKRMKDDMAFLREQMEAAEDFARVAYLMALNDAIRKGLVLRGAVAEYNAAMASKRAPYILPGSFSDLTLNMPER